MLLSDKINNTMVAFILPLNRIEKSPHLNRLSILSEEQLVKSLQAGETKAIDYLYRKYADSLYGIISRIVKFDEVAEDTLQDTFLKIWRSISQYDSSKGRLFTWMANLAKNSAIDQVRSKNYMNCCKTDDISEMSAEIIERKNATQFNPDIIGMKQLMMNLKADQKHVLDLVYFKGYTQAEVADYLDMPLGTVKTKIRLSILALRKYFNETATC